MDKTAGTIIGNALVWAFVAIGCWFLLTATGQAQEIQHILGAGAGYSLMLAILGVPGSAGLAAPAAAVVRLTVLYDNTAAVAGTQADWGFACLVETGSGRVLFDTGTKSEILRSNADLLEVDLSHLDAVVLSHEHGDHIGGLRALPRPEVPVPLYVPVSFSAAFEEYATTAGWKVVRTSGPATIIDGVRVTGEIDGPVPEQALLVDSTEGALVLTGCAHPGVVEIVRAVVERMDVEPRLVLGGFHLLSTSLPEVQQVIERLRSLGIVRVGATHCTGGEAIEEFQHGFGDHFVGLGVGATLELAAQVPSVGTDAPE